MEGCSWATILASVRVILHFNNNKNKALAGQTHALIEQVHVIRLTAKHSRMILPFHWEMWFLWSGCWITRTRTWGHQQPHALQTFYRTIILIYLNSLKNRSSLCAYTRSLVNLSYFYETSQNLFAYKFATEFCIWHVFKTECIWIMKGFYESM